MKRGAGASDNCEKVLPGAAGRASAPQSMNPSRLVDVWISGLAVLLDRRYNGSALIPAGRLVGEALEHPARARWMWQPTKEDA